MEPDPLVVALCWKRTGSEDKPLRVWRSSNHCLQGTCAPANMDTILVFSLIITSYDANKKELRESRCQVEQLPRIFPSGESVRVVPAQETRAAVERPTSLQNWTVASLRCAGSEGTVDVKLHYWEKKPPSEHALRSLRVLAVPRSRGAASSSCHLRSASTFRSGFLLRGTAFLPGISQCKVDPVRGAPAEHLLGIITTRTPGNTNGEKPTDRDEDLEKRKKWSLLIKALIAFTLLTGVVVIMVFVIFEVPCPSQCLRIREQCQSLWLWRRLRKGGQSLEAAETQINPQPKKVEQTGPVPPGPQEAEGTTVLKQTYL